MTDSAVHALAGLDGVYSAFLSVGRAGSRSGADEGVRPTSDSACERIAYRANNSCGKGDGSPERITGAQCKKLAVPVFLINCSWA